jgi:hypothetical protein
MGMGGTGSGVQSMSVVLMQAKGELATLESRIIVTRESVDTLEAALALHDDSSMPVVHYLEKVLTALIQTNLKQLHANLKEGSDRVEYLKRVISSAESRVKPSIAMPPGMSLKKT